MGFEDVYKAICDVDIEFDILFKFMCENPGSETTKMFLEYHIEEMGDPRLENGKPEFTYIIGACIF